MDYVVVVFESNVKPYVDTSLATILIIEKHSFAHDTTRMELPLPPKSVKTSNTPEPDGISARERLANKSTRLSEKLLFLGIDIGEVRDVFRFATFPTPSADTYMHSRSLIVRYKSLYNKRKNLQKLLQGENLMAEIHFFLVSCHLKSAKLKRKCPKSDISRNSREWIVAHTN